MRKAKNIIAIVLIVLVLSIGIVIWWLQTDSGQAFVTRQTVSYLRSKIKTPFQIQKIRYSIPDWVALEGVYFEDQSGDTLAAGKRIHVDLDVWGLLKGEVNIDNIELESIRAKVTRTLPGAKFNFQYLVDAFASDEPSDTAASKPLKMRLDNIVLRNVHANYLDDVTGVDTEARIRDGKVTFSAFNPSYNRYHPTKITLNDSKVMLRTFKGIDSPDESAEAGAAAPGDTLDLRLGQIDVKNLFWNYADEKSGLSNGLELGSLHADIQTVHLGSKHVRVNEVNLTDSKTFVEFAQTGKKPEAKKTTPSANSENGWIIDVNQLSLANDHVRYDDFNSKPVAKGMDYGHLDLQNIYIQLKDFRFDPKNISGAISAARFSDKSGFKLDDLRTDFVYGEKQTYLKNLFLKTPYSTLGNELVLTYASQAALTQDLGKTGVNLNLKNSRLGFKDLLTLVPDLSETPPFKSEPNGYVLGNALVTGTIDNLIIKQGVFSMLNGTKLDVVGNIKGLPDTDRLTTNLTLNQLAVTKSDILKLAPKGSLPSSIEIPDQIALSGKIMGSLNNLELDTKLTTSFGNGSFAGTLQNITDSLKATYKGNLTLTNFDLGKLMKQPPEQMGSITLDAYVDGHGTNPETMATTVKGNIQSVSLNGYTYHNLALNGTIEQGIANLNATIKDDNVDLTIRAIANLNEEHPSVKFETNVGNLDLRALNLYPEDLKIAGKIRADISSSNPDNPLGNVSVDDMVLTFKGDPIPLDSIRVQLNEVGGEKEALLRAPFLQADLKGNFSYTDLAAIVTSEINKYFRISDSVAVIKKNDYDFTLNGDVRWHRALQVFAKGLTKMDPVQFQAKLVSAGDTTLKFAAVSPHIEYDSIKIDQVKFDLSGSGNAADFNGNIGQVQTSGFRVRRASVNGSVSNDLVDFDFIVKDSLDQNRHALSGELAHPGDSYQFNLKKELLLDYLPWKTDSTGKIIYRPDGLLVDKFSIHRNNTERLLVNSISPTPNGPLDIKIENLAIGPFVTLYTLDSTLAKGTLDADIELRNYMDTPSFSGNMTINDLAVTQIAVGNLAMKATNEKQGAITLDARLQSDKNDLHLTGDYLTANEKNPFNLNLDIQRLDAKTVEAFSFGQLRNSRGTVSGKATIQGNTTNPLLNGAIKLDSVAFNVSQLGSRMRFHNNTIKLEKDQIVFDNFIVSDTANNPMQINGKVQLTNIPDVKYQLRLNTDKFVVLDASRKDNDYFYGKGVVRAMLRINGQGTSSSIDGLVKILNESNVSVLIPDAAAGSGGTEGVVEFVDMSDPTYASKTDSVQVSKVLKSAFASEMSVNIETEPNAQFTIVVDELNGDNLKVKGNAQLNVGMAPNGEIYILGAYNLNEGTYDLTFQVLKKQFQIKKGSSMIWTGDPMDAQLDITAIYQVIADPGPIDPGGGVYGKVPLDVELKIGGTINNLLVTFGISPSEKGDESIKSKLRDNRVFENLANNEAEMNKQVFALLVLNKFMSDQSGAASFEGFSAESVARQSVSKLLTEQLNMLASDLIKGVNLDLNLNSSADATSGARTDLSVGLSKGFLNDRLTVSVGRNFELENSSQSAAQSSQVLDNIAVNYALTKDGRYKVRAYRKNQYQAALEGFIVETGLGFIITFDYDLFKEIFQKQAAPAR